jgi:ankyrin repeat protein
MENITKAASTLQLSRSLLKTLQVLLDFGADVNTECIFMGTALHLAYFLRNELAVKLLLDRGADVNANGGLFETPLFAALYSGWRGVNHKIIRMILEKGADVSGRSRLHLTPLRYPCCLIRL